MQRDGSVAGGQRGARPSPERPTEKYQQRSRAQKAPDDQRGSSRTRDETMLCFKTTPGSIAALPSEPELNYGRTVSPRWENQPLTRTSLRRSLYEPPLSLRHSSRLSRSAGFVSAASFPPLRATRRTPENVRAHQYHRPNEVHILQPVGFYTGTRNTHEYTACRPQRSNRNSDSSFTEHLLPIKLPVFKC